MGASTDILPFNMKFTSCIFVAALLVAAVHAEDEHTDEEKYGSGLEEDQGFWPPIEEGAFYQANNHLGLPDDEFVQQMGCVIDCTGADAKVCDEAKAKFAAGNLAASVVAACGDKDLVTRIMAMGSQPACYHGNIPEEQIQKLKKTLLDAEPANVCKITKAADAAKKAASADSVPEEAFIEEDRSDADAAEKETQMPPIPDMNEI